MGAPTAEQDTEQQTPRKAYANWPQKGDERPQPWDLDEIGISKADRELADGEPDTVSPAVIRQSYPVLGQGSAGAPVAELATRLKILGYATDISQGENPFSVLTNNVMGAVERFREDYGVQEAPTGAKSPSALATAAETVGPWTWEGLVRASDRALAESEG